MIRGRVTDIIECFTRDGDYMLLTNFEFFGCFETERKTLRRPAEHHLPNLTPLWPNGNFGAYRSNFVTVGILKRDVNVAVRFHFCVNDAARERIPFFLRGHSSQFHIRRKPFPCVNLRWCHRLNRGLIRWKRRQIGLGNPPIFPVKAPTLAGDAKITFSPMI